MTKENFNYALKACGCMYYQDKKYYEHNELVKCFEDLGLFDRDSSDEKQRGKYDSDKLWKMDS